MQTETLSNIRSAAVNEFLEKGFQKASLRTIVKKAGVTTGAFYGYYSGKEELFGDLTADVYHELISKYQKTLAAFEILPVSKQESNMYEFVYEGMLELNDYIYDNLTAFKLIMCCSEGTSYDGLIDEMAAFETKATHNFVSALSNNQLKLYPQLEQMLIVGMFSAYFEMFVHDLPREDAPEYTRQLLEFYMAGWQKIIGFNADHD